MNKTHQQHDTIDAPEFKTSVLSGRPTWDDRGNSVWEWQTAPGVYTRDISSQQLQALQASDLCLDDGLPGQSAHCAWRRETTATFASTSRHSNELVMPSRRKEIKTSAFDGFLKRLGLPA